ncbi:MAG TPA: hypothetical protein VEA99_12270 [Gemmatimonadaceae bacterium]|nr:hypothetical protein [Gemmatimonadaceae bacterium]
MIWTYAMLVLGSGAITAALWRRRASSASIAALATAMAAISLLAGFSIGWAIAPVAILLLTVAVVRHLASEPSAAKGTGKRASGVEVETARPPGGG